MTMSNTYTAFDGERLFFQGTLDEVIPKIKKKLGKEQNSTILIFSDSTGKTMDFNFQGSESDVLKRLEMFTTENHSKSVVVGPGRPKLGVISREVSLLPRHWEWLANQSSGASSALRSLVEEAMKKSAGGSDLKLAQERTYKFISTMAGNLAGYEEALRALYKKDQKKFLSLIQDWPPDLRKHTIKLAKPVFVK